MTDSARSALALHLKARENIAGLLAPFTLAQLNTVPAGFNNNLIWNAGHVIATCELLTYGLAGKPTPSDRAFIDRYRKGTRPEAPAGQAEADRIVAGLNGGHRQLAEAIENGRLGRLQALRDQLRGHGGHAGGSPELQQPARSDAPRHHDRPQEAGLSDLLRRLGVKAVEYLREVFPGQGLLGMTVDHRIAVGALVIHFADHRGEHDYRDGGALGGG